MKPTVVTTPGEFAATAESAPAGARVPVEVRVDVADPFVAYRRARRSEGGFYLATTGGKSGWGYFGIEPEERLTVRPGGDAAGDTDGDSLAALADLVDGEAIARDGCDVPYPCGVVGWLSYDIARELEALPDATDDERGLPRLSVGVYDCMAAWEEPRDGAITLRVTACPRVDAPKAGSSGTETGAPVYGDPSAAYEAGRERALALARAAVDGDPAVADPNAGSAGSTGPSSTVRFESDCGRAAFAERVRRIKRAIREGETFQANVSHRLRAPAAVHPVEAFDSLRAVNPAPYSGLLEFPAVDLVSASPELLLARDGRDVWTEPIAGTRPRGASREADAALEDDLRGDRKERAEHAMLVDLERNDLGAVCEHGSVDVAEYRRVDRYAEVMHLVSLVDGRLREDVGLAEAIAAVFPGGTITGAPKPRTMGLIEEVEATRRGPYTGSVALVGFDGRATLDILIRTLVRHDGEYHLRVGAGVVHDSDPEREYDETLDKARALVTAIDDALGEQGTASVAPESNESGTQATEAADFGSHGS